jgi:hypothetical protein
MESNEEESNRESSYIHKKEIQQEAKEHKGELTNEE